MVNTPSIRPYFYDQKMLFWCFFTDCTKVIHHEKHHFLLYFSRHLNQIQDKELIDPIAQVRTRWLKFNLDVQGS